MEEVLITFETAVLAKKKGFNIHCREYFTKDGTECENEDFPYNSYNENLFRPTQALLQKWLRELHIIHVSIAIESIGSDEWVFAYKISWLPKENWEDKRRMSAFKYKSSFSISIGSYVGGWDTYEAALEVGLQKALKLIR